MNSNDRGTISIHLYWAKNFRRIKICSRLHVQLLLFLVQHQVRDDLVLKAIFSKNIVEYFVLCECKIQVTVYTRISPKIECIVQYSSIIRHIINGEPFHASKMDSALVVSSVLLQKISSSECKHQIIARIHS